MNRPEPQDNLLLGRVPPQSKEAEQAVLGAMLLDPKVIARVVPLLAGPDSFYWEAHRKIYMAILALADKKEPVDIVTVQQLLTDRGQLEDAGGAAYLAGLPDNATPGNVESYAKTVVEKATLRSCMTVGHELVARASGDGAQSDRLLTKADELIRSLRQRSSGGDLQQLHIKDLTHEATDHLVSVLLHKEEVIGLPTGFHYLDRLLSGLQKGYMITIGARPSIGKTSLATNIAVNVAKLGKHVLFFSVEQNRRELMYRIFATELRVDGLKLKRGYGGVNADQIRRVSKKISELPLYIDDANPITTQDMMRTCQQLLNQDMLDLVVIDYLQLMAESTDQADVARVSKGVKTLAKTLDVPVLVLSQLSREHESAKRRPGLRDLKSSGAIEEDSDVVVFAYIEALFSSNAEVRAEASRAEYRREEHTVQLEVAKHRNGPTGDLELVFFPDQYRFENMSYRDEPDDNMEDVLF